MTAMVPCSRNRRRVIVRHHKFRAARKYGRPQLFSHNPGKHRDYQIQLARLSVNSVYACADDGRSNYAVSGRKRRIQRPFL